MAENIKGNGHLIDRGNARKGHHGRKKHLCGRGEEESKKRTPSWMRRGFHEDHVDGQGADVDDEVDVLLGWQRGHSEMLCVWMSSVTLVNPPCFLHGFLSSWLKTLSIP